MAYDEDYLELMDNAQDAIRALLAESAEESWIELRSGLREIGQATRSEQALDVIRRLKEESREDLERLRREEADERRDALTQPSEAVNWRSEYIERKRAWRRMPMARKEGLVIEALGDDQVPLSDLGRRVSDLLGWMADDAMYWAPIENAVQRLLASGQLDRVQMKPGVCGVFHYFRKRDLTGPIAELERAWRDDDGAVA